MGKREHGAVRRRLSFPAGVLSCEVPGSDCPSKHHCEVLYQELAAQRCLHSGEPQAWGGWGKEALLSLVPALIPLIPHSPDPSDGLPGPCGCGGRRSPLVGHPPGHTGRAAGAGAAGAAHVEGEARGGGAGGLPCRAGGLSCCGSPSHPRSHLFSQSALNTGLSQGLSGSGCFREKSDADLVLKDLIVSLVEEMSLVVEDKAEGTKARQCSGEFRGERY